jgi:hypothetical protein
VAVLAEARHGSMRLEIGLVHRRRLEFALNDEIGLGKAGFDIAKAATSREDLQLRMQGNAFLGAFFAISGTMEEYGVSIEQLHALTRAQYEKKFGRFGEAVVESNMVVMTVINLGRTRPAAPSTIASVRSVVNLSQNTLIDLERNLDRQFAVPCKD